MTAAGKHAEKLEPLSTAGGDAKWCRLKSKKQNKKPQPWRTARQFLKKLNIQDSAPAWERYSKNRQQDTEGETHAQSSIIHKSQKVETTKSPPMDEWINKT